MSARVRPLAILGVLASGLWLTYMVAGLDTVPFHPDESSLLFQSRDLEIALTEPRSLSWTSEREMTQELEYRLLNAPLAKYAIGIARLLARVPPEAVEVDWDWSQTWSENLAAGALPDRQTLLAARTASLVGLAAGGVFLALWGLKVRGPLLAVLAVLSYALSAYQLLHGRRAMAEGILLAVVCLWIFAAAHLRSRPWLLGIASALSLAAKHSTAPIVLIGAVFAIAHPALRGLRPSRVLAAGAAYISAAAVVFAALNPVLWAQPAGAVRAAVRVRTDLVERQLHDRQPARSVISFPLQRLAVPVGLIFVTDLQFQEVGNYAEQLEEPIEAYQAIPGHTFDRGLVPGAVRLILVLFGVYAAIRGSGRGSGRKPHLAILLAAGFAQLAALALLNPLPFQRYYTPVLPFVHVFTAWGLDQVIAEIRTSRQAPESDPPVNLAGNRRADPGRPATAAG